MSKKRRPDRPIDRKARKIRGVFYVIFGGATLWIAVAICVGVVGGINANAARDPFTDRPVQEMHDACDAWAQRLLDDLDEEHPAEWQVRTASWRWRCSYRAEHSSSASELIEKHGEMLKERRRD